MTPRRSWLTLFLLVVWIALSAAPAAAQYFGRNQVTYDEFDFRVLETEHYEIYYYPDEEQAARDAARMAERWYSRHARTFLNTYGGEKKPLILYANDADFMQTNIAQRISQGVGGFTESQRERVVLPFTGSYGTFNQVLGHELVHSFQYDLALHSDSLNIQLQRLPSWLVEGMAEYLSLGRKAPHTAMWMRDAILFDYLPTFDQLSNTRKYFPYRYGQAFLAYIGGKYGDQAVTDLFKVGGQIGMKPAFQQLFGITADSLAKEWTMATRDAYAPLIEGRTHPDSVGQAVLTDSDINIAPSLSPDGRYVAYISSNIFNLTLFVADAQTGEVIAKLDNAGTIAHFDALRFISSAGSWNPTGEKFAFISFAEGDNEIAIWNVNEDDITQRFAVRGIGAMKNVAWSPDGTKIAFSGMDGGISDLYVLDLQTKEVRQLTNDRYADLQPTWSPSGETIAFATDRGTATNFETMNLTTEMRLGLIDVSSGNLVVRQPFDDALHHNPQFSPNGQSLYFISDQDGFQDVYRMELASGDLFRVTRVKTGVSGITELSPAMSVARQSGDVMFSVYADGKYQIMAFPDAARSGTPMERSATPVAARANEESVTLRQNAAPDALPAYAGVLPPYDALDGGLVSTYLRRPRAGLPNVAQYPSHRYDPTLSLTAIVPPTFGTSVGGPLGTQVSGGVGFKFSDMLNNQTLTAVVQAQGSFKDIGGQVSYVNRDNQWDYGASAGHIPQRYRQAFVTRINGVPVINQLTRRIFIDQASVFGSYPFSPTKRFEMSAGGVRYGFDTDVRSFLSNGRRVDLPDSLSFQLPDRDALYLAQSSAAYVVDYSFMGLTSPIRGGRYRFEVAPLLGGSSSYVKALADVRRYVYARPVTFAFQGLHIGNYGADANELFASEYVGLPYYRGFVRGYNIRSFNTSDCPTPNCQAINNLIGTRMAKVSAEVRVPLLGPPQISLIPFQYVPTEIALFADGGVAWTGNEAPVLEWSSDIEGRTPVFSAGVAARFNVLGALVLETYWAYPFQRPNSNGEFGLLFTPGW